MTSNHGLAHGEAMHCMEIRGGSQAIEESIAMPGLDAWVSSHPHEGADSGGDLHYLSVCGGGLIARLIVADVSGHGMSVAEFASSLRGLMRKNINTKDQTRLLRALNRQFTEVAQGRRFATAIIATYLADRRRLTVCNAGHPRPLWYRAGAGFWELMVEAREAAGNLPLGIDDETSYRQFAVELAPGDVVLFYTDALTEATDPAGRMLGEEGMLGLARDLDVSDPERLGSALLSGIHAHRGGRPADDDATLLALRHNASGPRHVSLAEKLDVYAKVFGLRDY
jgi:sigma-B regulation protein RsbU (phosphoserine phosphatase)